MRCAPVWDVYFFLPIRHTHCKCVDLWHVSIDTVSRWCVQEIPCTMDTRGMWRTRACTKRIYLVFFFFLFSSLSASICVRRHCSMTENRFQWIWMPNTIMLKQTNNESWWEIARQPHCCRWANEQEALDTTRYTNADEFCESQRRANQILVCMFLLAKRARQNRKILTKKKTAVGSMAANGGCVYVCLKQTPDLIPKRVFTIRNSGVNWNDFIIQNELFNKITAHRFQCSAIHRLGRNCWCERRPKCAGCRLPDSINSRFTCEIVFSSFALFRFVEFDSETGVRFLYIYSH